MKIVYYGPPLSGKTTNLEYIHSRLDPRVRGQLVSLKTKEDRTIYFDFMQLEMGWIKGLKPKFNLYTVPGQVIYVASRKLVLQGADGVIYVADSQPDKLEANIETLDNLEDNLRELGYNPEEIPLVMQFNKRDLPQALPAETLRSYLARDGAPCFEAVAVKGQGVIDTLKAAINLVVARV